MQILFGILYFFNHAGKWFFWLIVTVMFIVCRHIGLHDEQGWWPMWVLIGIVLVFIIGNLQSPAFKATMDKYNKRWNKKAPR